MAEGMYELYNCVFDGSISGHHCQMERRPYHRNCGCALHQSRGGFSQHRCDQVSYPMRRSWSEGTLCLAMSANTNSTASTIIHSPSSSPASTWDHSVIAHN